MLSSSHDAEEEKSRFEGGSADPPAKPKQNPPNPTDATLIVAFDAEWVSDAPGVGQMPRNIILSYQYACRYHGRAWSGIVYARAGARIRTSRTWPLRHMITPVTVVVAPRPS